MDGPNPVPNADQAEAPRRATTWELIKQMFFVYFLVSSLVGLGQKYFMPQSAANGSSNDAMLHSNTNSITLTEARRLTNEKALQAQKQQEYMNSIMGKKSAIGFTQSPARVFPTIDTAGNPLGAHKCLLANNALVTLQVYVTDLPRFNPSLPNYASSLIFEVQNIAFNWSFSHKVPGLVHVPITHDMIARNVSLFAHIFVLQAGDSIESFDPLHASLIDDESEQLVYQYDAINGSESLPRIAYRSIPLMKHRPQKRVKALRNLLNSTQTSDEQAALDSHAENDTPLPYLTFWTPSLNLSMVLDIPQFPRNHVPATVSKHISFTPEGDFYPVIYHNEFWQLAKNLPLLNKTLLDAQTELLHPDTLPLALSYSHLSFFAWQMQTSLEDQWSTQQASGMGTERESDMMREMLLDTSPWLLGLTFVVSLLHTVFDMLAFKNDVQFWRKKKSMAGLSVRSLVVNCFFQSVILAYLFDNDTSMMILFSSSVGLAIEYWKLSKAFNFSYAGLRPIPYMEILVYPHITYELSASYTAIESGAGQGPESLKESTARHDYVATVHLLYLCVPLMVGYSIFSLTHSQHKSFYSWFIGSLVGFVYAFGFILMTPQLFINYKLKSVAHMPWRAMVYKALNTFIDDLFAFIIKMPTMHRLACFRDDLIFFVYLYQKWVYPVDPSRINEFGQGGEGEGEGSSGTEVQKHEVVADRAVEGASGTGAGLDGDE